MINATLIAWNGTARVSTLSYSSRRTPTTHVSAAHGRSTHKYGLPTVPLVVLWHEDNEEITLADAEAFIAEFLLAHIQEGGDWSDDCAAPCIMLNYPDADARAEEQCYFIPPNSERQEDLILRSTPRLRVAALHAEPFKHTYAAIIALNPLPALFGELHPSSLNTTVYVYDKYARRSEKVTYADLMSQCGILQAYAPGLSMDLAYNTCATCAIRGPMCVALQAHRSVPVLRGAYDEELDPRTIHSKPVDRVYRSVTVGEGPTDVNEKLRSVKSTRFNYINATYVNRGKRSLNNVIKGSVALASALDTHAFGVEGIKRAQDHQDETLGVMHDNLRKRYAVCGTPHDEHKCVFAGSCKRFDTCSKRVHSEADWDYAGAAAFNALGPEPMRQLRWTHGANKIVRELSFANAIAHDRSSYNYRFDSLRLVFVEHAMLREPFNLYDATMDTVLQELDMVSSALGARLYDLWLELETPPEDPEGWGVLGWQIMELQRCSGRLVHPHSSGGWHSLGVNGLVAAESYRTGRTRLCAVGGNGGANLAPLSFYDSIFALDPDWVPSMFKID